jgi:hypothetical protein
MRNSPLLNSYPVFPNWVFTGELLAQQQDIDNVLTQSADIAHTEYGSHTIPGRMNRGIYNLTRLVGSVFYDTAVSHFRLSKDWRNIESVDAQVLTIQPGKCVPHGVSRHRWYRAAAFLKCGAGSSDIYLEMMDSKLHCNPPGAQESMHHIRSENLKIAFWPAHIPWGITYNQSATDTVIFTSTFIIKRTE